MNPGDAAPTLRVLTFSSLFPSVARPRHGIFVATRLRQLLREPGIDARVIAPVPWFPSRAARFGDYAQFAATPRHARCEPGVAVSHPRYPMLPKVGVALQPDAMAWSAAADLRALQRGGWRPDLIDAHYLYPDGVAAALLARRFGLPFVMTARGTDVNVLARQPGPGRRIAWAAGRAEAVITVSRRLRDTLVELGVDAAKICVLRNGVDLEVFRPDDAPRPREALGLGLKPGPLALCVGNLRPEKGYELAVDALGQLPGWQLLLVGEGPERAALQARARAAGLADRVHFAPAMPQAQLRAIYAAADLLLLTSTREGWPNVVLESLACGTPVVAVDVGAVDEMLTDPAVGRVVVGREPAALAAAARDVQAMAPPRDRVRAHAARFGWAVVSQGQREVFARAVAKPRPGAALPA